MLWHRIGVIIAVAGLLFLGVAGRSADAASITKQPRIALDPKLQARAKHVTIEPRDLPSGWAVDPVWDRAVVARQGPVFACKNHGKSYSADFSKLVVLAAWSSRNALGQGTSFQRVTSGVVFDATVQQAKIEFSGGVVLYPRCVDTGSATGGAVVESVRRLRLPVIADQEIGFRSVVANPAPAGKVWADIVFLRRGTVYAQAVFERSGNPFDPTLEEALLKKLVSRAHA